MLTGLITTSTTWLWGLQEEQAFEELREKGANAKCSGVPNGRGEIVLLTDASKVGGGGRFFEWQPLEKEEFESAISCWGTDGLKRDGTLKHRARAIGTGIRTGLGVSMLPMNRKCSWVCWCYPLSPDY